MKIVLRKNGYEEKISEIEQRIIKRVNNKKKKTNHIAIIIFLLFEFVPVVAFSLMYFLTYDKIRVLHQLILLSYLALHCFFLIYTNKKFSEEIEFFVCSIACNLYFSWYTKKGKALSNEDFEMLKEDKTLYQSIKLHKCRGYCVNTCFNILKLLESGKLKFVAITDFGENPTSVYVLHVMYENNGWVYDTYSNQQFTIDEMLDFYEGRLYKDFSYEEIKALTFDEFMDMQEDATTKWCEENNVQYFVMADE